MEWSPLPNTMDNLWRTNFFGVEYKKLSLTLFLREFPFISTEPKLAIKQLDCNDSEDKLEEDVDNKNVEHILQRSHHTIKHGLFE